MAKLLITTQVYENYGDADKPYWKAKGGGDYVVKNFKKFNKVTEVVMALRGQANAQGLHGMFSTHSTMTTGPCDVTAHGPPREGSPRGAADVGTLLP